MFFSFFGTVSFGQNISIKHYRIRVPDDSGWKYGYINSTGKVVVEPQYSYAQQYVLGDVFWVKKIDELSGVYKYFLVNTSGDLVVKDTFDLIEKSFVINNWVFRKNGKWGILDSTGQTKVPFKYDKLSSFLGGVVTAKFNNSNGYLLESNTNEYIPFPENENYEYIGEGKFSVEVDESFGVYDAYSKKIIIDPIYYKVSRVRYGQVLLTKKGLNGPGIYDLNQEKFIVEPGIYSEIWLPDYVNLNESMAMSGIGEDSLFIAIDQSNKSGKYCVLNFLGKKTATLPSHHIFHSNSAFFGGLCSFLDLEQYLTGYINSGGEIIIKPQFKGWSNFSEGAAGVSIGSKMGYIDQQGANIIPFAFSGSDSFKGGLFFANESETNENNQTIIREGYVNKSGEWVWSITYSTVNDN